MGNPSVNRFGAFEEFKKRSVDANGNLSAGQRLLCGLGAGVAEAIFAVTPMETVKVKFINDQRSKNPQFKGFFHGVRTIIKNEGLLQKQKSGMFFLNPKYIFFCNTYAFLH